MRYDLKGEIMRVVIVEDDVIPANYLKKILEREGYDVVAIIQKGQDAITVAQLEKPDIMMMDIMLKDNISGAEAAKEIHYNNPKIIIIFLTAYSDKEMIDYAIESDAFAYLLKPYRDKEILATLSLAKAKYEEKKSESVYRDVLSDIIELADGYSFNIKLHRLFLGTKEVKLSKKSSKLIDVLCANRHITLDIDTLMMSIWDNGTSEQALRSLVYRVREKTSFNVIHNSNSFGYSIGLKE